MENLIEEMSAAAVVPVAVIENPADAVPLAKALCEGGLRFIEVTFRTAGAAESIRRIAREVPDAVPGAGTVRSAAQVDEALAAGARFIVSPGFVPGVVERSLERKVPVIPGCMTPTEIERASSYGLSVLKFFPAEAAGGAKMLAAFAGVYAGIRFMPTGGIGLANLGDYLTLKNVLACGGSWMVKKPVIASGDFEKIRRDAAECAAKAAALRGAKPKE